MNDLGIPLECFNLDEREFDRSINWANIMKHYSANDSGSEVDFENLDSNFPDEKGEDDEEDIIKFDVGDDDEERPFDQSVLQLRSFSSTLVRSQSRKNPKHIGAKLRLPFVEEEEEDSEDKDQLGMQSLLDQTIPMLVERKRKWKESGMLRVLNTFDEEKIERMVGSWLRHNSHSTNSSVQPEKFTEEEDDDDENESLHSIDTARYVLSNRKPRYNGNFCNSTTIKSYRRLQSKRDALREKYAFPEDELDRAVLERSKKKIKRKVKGINNDLARHVKTREISDCCSVIKTATGLTESELLNGKKKRKHLSKERLQKWCLKRRSCESSSSDEDYGCGQNNCISKQSKRYSCIRRPLGLPSFKRSSVFAPLRLNLIASPSIHKKQLTSAAQTRAVKPRKRASDCCCHNKGKLCLQTDHLADTSTEEWLVENCDSPRKLLTKKRKKSPFQSDKEKVKCSELKGSTETTVNRNRLKTNRKKTTKCSLSKDDKIMGENENEFSCEDTFQTDLKLAIKLSKEMQKKEAKRTKNKIEKKKKDTKSRNNATLPKKQNSARNTSKDDNESDSSIGKFEDKLKLADKHSKLMPKTEIKRNENKIEKKTKKHNSTKHSLNKNVKPHDKKEKSLENEFEEFTKKDSTIGLNDEEVNMTSLDIPAKVCSSVRNEAIDDLEKVQRILPTIQETIREHSQEKETIRTEAEVYENEYCITKKAKVKAIDNSSCTAHENGATLAPAEFPTIIDDFSPNQLGLRPQPRSVKIKKFSRLVEKLRSATITPSNETFLTRADRICNSTAVTGDVAAVHKQISAESSSSVNVHSAEQIHAEIDAEEKVTADTTLNENDCFIVSSTTNDPDNVEQPLPKSSRTRQNRIHGKDILLYTPHNRNSVPPECITDGVLNITEEYLSSFIGKKLANKFMRYYIGCRRFDANLTVYYRPPRNNWQDNGDETDSDVDELECLDRYGDLHVSFEN